MEPPQKKMRAPPRNHKQHTFMVDFMVQNRNVALNKFGNSFHAKDDINKGWDTLVSHLNKIGPAKSRESWEKTWKDTKCNVSKRYSAMRQQRAKTGNNALPGDLKTGMRETDLKVLSILGPEYVDGSSSCLDSTPDSLDDIRALMDGTTCSTATAIDIGNVEELLIEDMPIVFKEDIPVQTSSSSLVSPTATSSANSPGPSSTLTPTAVANKGQRTNTKSSRFRSNRERLGVQFQEARQDFADLQRQNCEALQTCAQALCKMADNEGKFIQLETQRLELERERLKVEKERTTLFGALFSVLDKVVEKGDKL